MQISILWTLFACSIGPRYQEDLPQEVVDEPVDVLIVDVSSGDVDIERDGAIDTIIVERHIEYNRKKPKTTLDLRDGVLTLTGDCSGNCSVHHVITVSSSMEVRITSGAGSVRADELAGSMSVELGAGDIDLSSFDGDLMLSTDAGNVDAERVYGGEVWAHSGAGNINLDLLQVPTLVDGSTNAGNVWVGLPSGTYALDVHTNAGNRTVNGVSDGQGPTLRAHSSAGNVKVEGR